MTFPSYWEWIITPTDFHSIIFQRGRSTTNQKCYSVSTDTSQLRKWCHEIPGLWMGCPWSVEICDSHGSIHD
jgi:hypothetical protein